MGKNRNRIKKRERKVKEMIEIKNAVTPSSEQINFIIGTMISTYGVEDHAKLKSGFGCSKRWVWGNPERDDLLCKDCSSGMNTKFCPGIDKHYILSESDKELLLRDIVGFMSYIMVYFTISGPSDFIRDFVNFDLFLNNCDDIFHTILEPHFIKLESVNYGGDIYQKCHVVINYPALSNMYTVYNHTEDKNWQDVCKWISSLPYSDLITSSAYD